MAIVRPLVLLTVAVWIASPATARQTGPRTLEDLLDPATDARNRVPAPPGEPRPDVAADPTPRPPADPRPSKRLPIPEQAAVQEALELINQAYEEQFKAAASNPDAAIQTFRVDSDKTTDAGRKYALLLVAERIAVEAGSTSQALEIIARQAAAFEIDPLQARHDLLVKMTRADGTHSDARFFGPVVETAEKALAADRFDLADAAADLALLIARAVEKDEKARLTESRRKREPPPAPVAAGLLADATKLQKRARERRQLTSDYVAARDRLATTPDDAAAAETVGRFLCFVKNDWQAGLAALAKGAHEGLRNVAARECALKTAPKAAASDILKLANDWWKLASDDAMLSPADAAAAKKHAGIMYGDIAATLNDPIDAALARKRAKEMGIAEKAAPTPKPADEVLARPGPGSTTTPRTLDEILPVDGR